MRRLGRGALARSRAERIVLAACRYIRNEGREKVLRGDVDAVIRMMVSIQMIAHLHPGLRDRMIEEIRQQLFRTIQGEREGALLVSTRAKPPYVCLALCS